MNDSRPERAARAVSILALAIVGVVTLASKDVWEDEAYTASAVGRPFGSLLRLIGSGSEVNAALYNVVEWVVAHVVGGPAGLRVLSLVAWLLLVPVASMLAGRLPDRWAVAAAAPVLALGGVSLEYAQQARTYACSALVVALAVVALLVDLEEPSRARRIAWVALGIASAYLHLYALLAFGGALAGAVALALVERRRADLRRLVVGGLVLGVGLVPLAALLSRKSDAEGLQDNVLGARELAMSARTYALGFQGRVGLGVALVVVAAGAWGALRLLRRVETRRFGAVLVGWAAAAPLGLLVLSLAEPTLEPRYLIPALVPATLLAIAGVASAGRAGLGVLTVAAVVGGGVWLRTDPNPAWRTATTAVLAQAAPGDELVFSPDDVRLPFEYAATRRSPRVLGLLRPLYPAAPWGAYRTGDQLVEPPPAGVIDGDDPAATVWVVFVGDRDTEVRPTLARLSAQGRNPRDLDFRGALHVVAYGPAGEARQ